MSTQFITTHPPQRAPYLRQRLARRAGLALVSWSRRSAERAIERDRAVSLTAVAEANRMLRLDQVRRDVYQRQIL